MHNADNISTQWSSRFASSSSSSSTSDNATAWHILINPALTPSPEISSSNLSTLMTPDRSVVGGSVSYATYASFMLNLTVPPETSSSNLSILMTSDRSIEGGGGGGEGVGLGAGGGGGEGLVSYAAYASFLHVQSHVTVVVCALSLLFCAVNAGVYWGQRSSAFALYIAGVSACDGLYALMDVVVGLSGLFAAPLGSWWGRASSLYLNAYVGTSVRRAAIWLNVLASLERFFAIAFPLKVNKTGILSLAPVRTILAVTSASLLAHLYLLVEFRVEEVSEGLWNYVPSSLKLSGPDNFTVGKNAVRVMFFYLPLGLSLALNLALVVILHTYFNDRHNIRTSTGKTSGQGSDSQAERQTTKLILVYTFTFTLLALPRVVNSTLGSIIDGYGIGEQDVYLYRMLNNATRLLPPIAEILLFFVSMSYSRRFRETVSGMPFLRMCTGSFRRKSMSRSTAGSASQSSGAMADSVTVTETVQNMDPV